MIRIICVGKIKEKYLREAIEEYKKRLSKYTKIEIIEVNDVDDSNKDIALLKEKELIERHIGNKDYIITLEIDGIMLDSLELSNKIYSIFNTNSNITFIIGGSYGIHKDIKNRSNYKLSFSKLTFPHQLFRLILLEQIYRAFRIINNEAYHKWYAFLLIVNYHLIITYFAW